MLATWKSSPKISDLDRGGSTQPHNSLLLTFFHFQSSIDIDTDDAAEEEIATMVRFHKLAFGTAFVAVCTLIPSSPIGNVGELRDLENAVYQFIEF